MPNVSEQEMRAFLLGALSPEQQTELAAEIHTDAELQEELLAVKEELFDQYLAGSFTADEQQYFETHFLSTKTGRQKLHFARLLRDYRADYHHSRLREESFAHDRVPAPDTPVTPSPWFVNIHRNPAYAFPMIIAAGLLATLSIWICVRKSPTIHALSMKPALTLTAGSTMPGAGIKKLRAPANNDEVKVELEVAKSDFKKYRTQLFREDQALESQADLPIVPKNTHYVVPVTFTGKLLTPGEYKLELCGVPDSGQPRHIDSYSFRVPAESTASDADREPERLAR